MHHYWFNAVQLFCNKIQIYHWFWWNDVSGTKNNTELLYFDAKFMASSKINYLSFILSPRPRCWPMRKRGGNRGYRPRSPTMFGSTEPNPPSIGWSRSRRNLPKLWSDGSSNRRRRIVPSQKKILCVLLASTLKDCFKFLGYVNYHGTTFRLNKVRHVNFWLLILWQRQLNDNDA